MTTTTHTPEPWRVIYRDGWSAVRPDGTIACQSDRETCDRVVACVNACADLANPEGNLQQARRQLYNAIERAKAGGAHYKLVEEMTSAYTLLGGRL